jgi:hypothetical protein
MPAGCTDIYIFCASPHWLYALIIRTRVAIVCGLYFALIQIKQIMKEKKSIGSAGDKQPVQVRPPKKQQLNKKAEEYLKESGNIEDLPNPEDELEIKKTNNQPGKK